MIYDPPYVVLPGKCKNTSKSEEDAEFPCFEDEERDVESWEGKECESHAQQDEKSNNSLLSRLKMIAIITKLSFWVGNAWYMALRLPETRRPIH